MKFKLGFDFISKDHLLSYLHTNELYDTLKGIKYRDIKPLLLVYQVYKYIFFLPFLGISTTILATLCLSIAFVTRSKINSAWPVLWARLNSLMTPMTVKVIGSDNVKKDQSYIIAANHQSQYDIFVVYGWFPGEFRWVIKKELRKAPVIGYFCEKAGHVYIDRSERQKALASINEAKERIQNGTSILFFPEGTRNKDDEMLPFKKGAFRFAIDMQLPILPVTIVGTRDILPTNTMALFPGRAKMIIHKPLDVQGYSSSNMNDLMARVRAVIQKGINDYS